MTIPLKTIATPTTHYGSRLAGTMSFIVQRTTGVLNIAFAVFFLWLVVRLARADVSEMGDLLSNPVVAVVTGLLIVSVTMHMRAGMRGNDARDAGVAEEIEDFGLLLLRVRRRGRPRFSKLLHAFAGPFPIRRLFRENTGMLKRGESQRKPRRVIRLAAVIPRDRPRLRRILSAP